MKQIGATRLISRRLAMTGAVLTVVGGVMAVCLRGFGDIAEGLKVGGR